MKKIFVVEGAIINCQYGTKSGRIVLPIGHGKKIYKKSVLTVKDCKEEINIPCFGECKSPFGNRECKNRILSEQWSPGQTDVLLQEENILTIKSKLACFTGRGIIEIQTSGQEEAISYLMNTKNNIPKISTIIGGIDFHQSQSIINDEMTIEKALKIMTII